MTPDEIQQFDTRLKKIEATLASFSYSDRYIFQKHIQMLDGKDINLGGNKGTRIGLTGLQKMGFFGTTPVVQQSAITQPSGGGTIDSQARSAVTSVILVLQALGFTL